MVPDPSDIIAPALLDRCRLIKLRGHEKVALESGWPKDTNYPPDDPEILQHISEGNNFGIMVTNNTIAMDCDTEFMYSMLPDEWKETLTVITGRNGETGRHLFFNCSDSPERIKILFEDSDQIDPKTGKKPKPLGDVRSSDGPFYTVAAGSIHPDTGKQYRYVNPYVDLVTVKWQDILDLFSKFMKKPRTDIPVRKSFSIGSSLTESLGLHIEDFAMPVDWKKMPGGDLQGKHPVHGSTTGMNFAINKGKNVWHCWRHDIGGDPVAWIAYAHCGVSETECNNLNMEQFKSVKEWLKNNGYSKQITELDDKFHAPPPEVAKIDISKLTQTKKIELTEEDIEKKKKDAENRSKLPPFPELEPGIFKDYMDYGSRVSWAIEEFHFATFLACASMALRRRVVIEAGISMIYPNVFIMIVGQSTISGKSTVCNMAVSAFGKSIIYEEPVAKFNSTEIHLGTVSAPTLVQNMSYIHNALWYCDECGGIFDQIISWNDELPSNLRKAYDGTPLESKLSNSRRTKKDEDQRKWTCPTPFLSLLWNMTTGDIERIANETYFTTGFFQRFMWFYSQDGHPRENTKTSLEDRALVASIALKINSLRNALRVVPNDGIVFEVCKIIEKWYADTIMTKTSKKHQNYVIAIGRTFAHVYKIAAILSMFDPEFQETVLNRDKYPIEVAIPEKHAKMAIRIAEEYLIPRMMQIQSMCSTSDDKNPQAKVLKALTTAGGHMTRQELIPTTRLNKADLQKTVDSLKDSEEIDWFTERTPGAHNDTTIYIKL